MFTPFMEDNAVMIDFYITDDADVFTVDMGVAGMDCTKYASQNGVWEMVR